MRDNLLISVRGWTTDLDPRYPVFVDQLRKRGFVVHDVFIPGANMASLEMWAAKYLEEIDALPVDSSQRRFLGYCLGGHLLLEVAHRLCARGEPPRYVGLIDVRDVPPLVRIRRGSYRRYRVPFRTRLHSHARLLTGPYEPPSITDVVTAWYRAARANLASWRARGYKRRPQEPYWAELRLRYCQTFREVNCPVHLYNPSDSIDLTAGDPTCGLAPLLRGGTALRTFDGNHHSCVQGEAGERLIDLVVADLGSASDLWVDQRGSGRLVPDID